YYVESFLGTHRADIRGRVLEIGDATYTRRFGAAVTQSEVLHVAGGAGTIEGDLAAGTPIEGDRFDCVVLTQTLTHIFDCRAAVAELRRIVKPGGVVLATVPGISQISRYDMDRWGDYWRFTSLAARRLFEESEFRDVAVAAYGNVLSASAFLIGLAAEELTRAELDHADRDYEVTIGVRALK
ncbi:MAG TPA: methyltransferase domain-containing protein, partial [Thermoanaerobaculia bacterium]|nr:methyltransferase domain-containing protein [Thermoanaerobaculia bacterium]